jgi:purine nucleosidase
MTELLEKRLGITDGIIDVVIDTDTYNEVDDQFAVAYALRSPERLNVKALYAAPFYNEKSSGPADGMEKSYQELLRILDFMEYHVPENFVFRGSDRYMESADRPCENPAVHDLISKALAADKPLYVAAIGAITNVASAVLLEPEIIKKITVLWLGGSGYHWPGNGEFNLKQDPAASRTIFDCGVPLFQFPAQGVVDRLHTTVPELEKYLDGKSRIGTYLTEIVRKFGDNSPGWSKVIWDIAPAAYLLDQSAALMKTVPSPLLSEDLTYRFDESRHPIKYAYAVDRNRIFKDLFSKLAD